MSRRLIDAEKLKKHYAWWEDDERRALFDHIVDAQPTIDAEPVKHGKWKCTYSPNGFLLEQTCSECGLTFEEPSGVDYNYCPYCGCRMDEE